MTLTADIVDGVAVASPVKNRWLSKRLAIVVSSALLAGTAVVGSASGASAGSASATTRTVLAAQLTSKQTVLHTVGTATTYGFNELHGTSTTGSAGHVAVEMIGNIVYVKGSGNVFGFITFTYSDGSTIGVRMNGRATLQSSGTTKFAVPFTVIGGTGRYLTVSGSGAFTGSRSGTLGSAVDATFTLNTKTS